MELRDIFEDTRRPDLVPLRVITVVLLLCFFPFWPIIGIFALFLALLTWPISAFLGYSAYKLRNPHSASASEHPKPSVHFFPNTASSSSSKQSGKPMAISHRCGSGEHPENTVAAAKNSKSEALHVDLCKVMDGEVMCFADLEPWERNMCKLTGR